MTGIDLNRPILYKHSSLRFFKAGESHVSRLCKDDVLLLVYDGVLRFDEDEESFEIRAGQYHIQRHDSVQSGKLVSDTPHYLYVHFSADWTADGAVLPRSGTFEYAKLKTVMEELDTLAHSRASYIDQAGKFYELLSRLHQTKPTNTVANRMADFIAKECHHEITLEQLCRQFHFSKNHIINTFKKEFGMTPIPYMNELRLQKAAYLIEVTSDGLDSIAAQCGFQNYSQFYKLFVRKNGISPDKWREQKRMGQIPSPSLLEVT